MNKDDILTKILEQIEIHKHELDKLNAAYAVVSAMGDTPAKKEPLFTVTRTKTLAKPVGKLSVRVREMVLAELSKAEVPLSTSDIVKRAFTEATKQERKAVWNIMTKFYQDKIVTRDRYGAYSLARKSNEEAADRSEDLRVQVPT